MPVPIINKEPNTGRLQKEDNGTVNIADLAVPKTHLFHNGTTVPGDGTKFDNTEGRDILTFDIAGTSTSQVYEFHGVGPGNVDILVTCYRASDSESGTGTSVKGEIWSAPIKGLKQFYVKATTLSGGTAIVTGWAEKA